jgi:hypothetical protein
MIARFAACIVGGVLIGVPVFQYVGQAQEDLGGGPAAAGIASGVGLGLLASAFLRRSGPDL